MQRGSVGDVLMGVYNGSATFERSFIIFGFWINFRCISILFILFQRRLMMVAIKIFYVLAALYANFLIVTAVDTINPVTG